MLNAIPAAALEKALGQCLKLDPQAAELADRLSGKVVMLKLRHPDYDFFLHFTAGGITVSSDDAGHCDARICATPLALGRMAMLGHDHDSLFTGDIEISGDADVARQVRMLFDGFDIDWEEVLAGMVGDVLAHQIGVAVRGMQQWSKQSLHTLRRDTSEYLQDEVELLARREDVEAFLADVDTLRNDVERLEMRWKRLYSEKQSET